MNFIDRHKALIITFLLTGIVVLGLFSFHITKHSQSIAESYYELEPKELEELLELEEKIKELTESVPTTNQAVNEDEDFKELMKNFKSVSSNDFQKTQETLEKQAEEAQEAEEILMSESDNPGMSSGEGVNEDEFSKYDKVKDVLAMRSPEKNLNAKSNSANSTLTYSLKGRDMLDFDTPRYLCEDSGKIVVNITVNGQGKVVQTYINSSSNSNNECLIDHAMEYAKSVLFNSSSKASQLGTITFYFKGK